MYLYGASGHAKVIIDILRANHESIEALLMIMKSFIIFLIILYYVLGKLKDR